MPESTGVFYFFLVGRALRKDSGWARRAVAQMQ